MADALFGLVHITITLPTVVYIIYYNIYTINKVSIQRKKEKKKKAHFMAQTTSDASFGPV